MKDRCPEVPPKEVNSVPPVFGKTIIRAVKSEESVMRVILESPEGLY